MNPGQLASARKGRLVMIEQTGDAGCDKLIVDGAQAQRRFRVMSTHIVPVAICMGDKRGGHAYFRRISASIITGIQ
jgi:hypothetical protein